MTPVRCLCDRDSTLSRHLSDTDSTLFRHLLTFSMSFLPSVFFGVRRALPPSSSAFFPPLAHPVRRQSDCAAPCSSCTTASACIFVRRTARSPYVHCGPLASPRRQDDDCAKDCAGVGRLSAAVRALLTPQFAPEIPVGLSFLPGPWRVWGSGWGLEGWRLSPSRSAASVVAVWVRLGGRLAIIRCPRGGAANSPRPLLAVGARPGSVRVIFGA